MRVRTLGGTASGRAALALVTAAVAAGSLPGAALAGTTYSARPARSASKQVVKAWGGNSSGELGNGTTKDAATPVRVRVPSGVTISQIRSGCDHTVALTRSGGALAWGRNNDGQLGDGTTKNRHLPVRVKLPRGTRLTSVRAGCDHSLALTRSGTVLAWGLDHNGQLGSGGALTIRRAPVRVKMPAGVKVTGIGVGCSDSFAITQSGALYSWGLNWFGNLGIGTVSHSVNVPVKVKLPAGTRVSAVTGGCGQVMAITNHGLYAWGANASGQLGDGSHKNKDLPERISFPSTGAPLGKPVRMYAGYGWSMVLFSSGALLAWGDNAVGQLGDGTTASTTRPVAVALPAGVSVKAITGSSFDAVALSTTGKVLAWGDSSMLGTGSTTDSDIPVRVRVTGMAVTSISGGPSAGDVFVLGHASS